ncbi:MAG: glucose-1-phosphate adenylyltransferase, partial [Methylococcales bacterium]|nr:glucose-1-phosphate adenylyltransferase [Methylococcales bacterium]
GSTRDFGHDIIPAVIDEHTVNAYPFLNLQGKQSYWRDVGTIDAYWSANMELIGVNPDLNLYDTTWPIWTYQAQNPPAKFVFDDDDDRRGQAIDSMVAGGCIISGATVRHSLLFSNVKVNSYSLVQDSVILPETVIGRNCRITKAIVEKGCIIPEGMIIGEDRAEDEKRFFVSSEGVILVTPDMLGQERHLVK